jgi:hypothetical protein
MTILTLVDILARVEQGGPEFIVPQLLIDSDTETFCGGFINYGGTRILKSIGNRVQLSQCKNNE